jgi:hypothetical protein
MQPDTPVTVKIIRHKSSEAHLASLHLSDLQRGFSSIDLFHWVSRCGYSCQDRFVPPVDVGLNAPVKTQYSHQEDHQDPEGAAKPGLVGEEDVNKSLKMEWL